MQTQTDSIILVVFPYAWSDGYYYTVGRNEFLQEGAVVECEVGSRILQGVVWRVDCQADGALKHILRVRPCLALSKCNLKFLEIAALELFVNKGALLNMMLRLRVKNIPSYINGSTIEQINSVQKYQTWFAQFKKNPSSAQTFLQLVDIKFFNYLTQDQKQAVECVLGAGAVVGSDSSARVGADADADDAPIPHSDPRPSHNTRNLFLLTGKTGSGKTEVFLEIAAHIMHQHQVLLLLPEVFLADAMSKRFQKHFKAPPLLWHHLISKTAKDSIYNWALSGQAGVVVGTRSALFLPFTNLKLIVIDEEHDQSYKQSSGVRYNAHNIAQILAQIQNAKLLLVSATPKLEHAQFCSVIKLTRNGASDQKIEIVDMKKERGIISNKALKLLRENLINKNCSLIFLNRKGFAPIVMCSKCQKRLICSRCSVGMVFYKNINLVMCNLCGYNYQLPQTCCGQQWKMSGLGIEKVQQTINMLFPKAKTMCISSDLSKKEYDAIYKQIEDKTLDILIGTQIIAQGHHIPQLSLVVMLDADFTLLLPTYQSSELTHSLITQVKGRCGRGAVKGQFILQTCFPDHPLFKAIKNNQDQEFLSNQLEQRKRFNWPPFCRLVSIIVQHRKLSLAKSRAKTLAQDFCAQKHTQMQILGPVPSPILKKENIYRYRILIKFIKKEHIEKLLELAKVSKAIIDIDPQDWS